MSVKSAGLLKQLFRYRVPRRYLFVSNAATELISAAKQSIGLPPSTPPQLSFWKNPWRYIVYQVKESVPAKHPEFLPLFSLNVMEIIFISIAVSWSLTKEDVFLNHRQKIPPYEKYDNEHRYKGLQLGHKPPPPPELIELREALGPYHNKP